MISVTQILSPWQDWSSIRPEVLEAASNRGTRVHSLCAAYAQRLYIPRIDEDCQGYFDSFTGWFDSTVEEVIACECELVCNDNLFIGHPDAILKIRGDKTLSVADWKTPITPNRSWRIQLSTYQHLARVNGYQVDRVFPLRLSKDGKKPIVNEYSGTASRDLAVFLNALTVYRYFNEGKTY
jgi:hypothetical protein